MSLLRDAVIAGVVMTVVLCVRVWVRHDGNSESSPGRAEPLSAPARSSPDQHRGQRRPETACAVGTVQRTLLDSMQAQVDDAMQELDDLDGLRHALEGTAEGGAAVQDPFIVEDLLLSAADAIEYTSVELDRLDCAEYPCVGVFTAQKHGRVPSKDMMEQLELLEGWGDRDSLAVHTPVGNGLYVVTVAVFEEKADDGAIRASVERLQNLIAEFKQGLP